MTQRTWVRAGAWLPGDALIGFEGRFGADQRVLLALLMDIDGQPVHGAVVEIWQCDQQGHYQHPSDWRADRAFQDFGRVSVGTAGEYRFHTIRPVAYSGRTPHIHLKRNLSRSTLNVTCLIMS